MVYQNGGVIIVFGVRGKQEPLEESAIPLHSDSLITVLPAAACRHTGAGGRGGRRRHMHRNTHTHKGVYSTGECIRPGKLEYTHTGRESAISTEGLFTCLKH